MIKLAINIDESNLKLRLMSFNKTPIESKNTFEYYELPFATSNSVSYETAIMQTLEQFSEQKKFSNLSVAFVLNDNKVFCDYIELPLLKNNKLAETLEFEVASHFPTGNYKKIFVNIDAHPKTKRRYFAYLTKSETIETIFSAIKKFKFRLGKITFASATVTNALLVLRAKPELKTNSRREPVLFVDIKENTTRLTVIKDFKLAGFTMFPFGQDVLSDKNKGIEYFMAIIGEIRSTLINQYGMSGIKIRFNISDEFKDLFEESELINIKNRAIAPHLDLYGALIYELNKGMNFR